MLTLAGYQVVNVTPTSVSSVNDSLKQRIHKANAEEVDLFVSIHFNSAAATAQGTEVFYYNNPDEIKGVAQNIVNNFNKYGFVNRGVKKGNYYVLRNATVPAILVECGFLSNLGDMAKYDAYTMAKNIFDAIQNM